MAGARVVSNPEVMMGKPVVEGTRVTVELILEKISLGESMEQIVADESVDRQIASALRATSVTPQKTLPRLMRHSW